MTCHECGKDLLAYPCACGYQPTELKVAPWIVVDCATPGCFTAIRVRVDQHTASPVCKWCEQGESHAKMGHPAVDIRLREAS